MLAHEYGTSRSNCMIMLILARADAKFAKSGASNYVLTAASDLDLLNTLQAKEEAFGDFRRQWGLCPQQFSRLEPVREEEADPTFRSGRSHRRCAFCSKLTGRFRKCAACQGVHYCSTNCQRSHWPFHMHVCKEIAERAVQGDGVGEAYNDV